MRWQWAQAKCDVCGITFRTSRSDSKFCSNTCRQRAHRRKAQMQREMRKAVQSIEFIKNASQRHPELFDDGMAMLHQVLAVMPATVTHPASAGED